MANRKEPKQISFRVSQEEFKRLEEMAEQLGMTVPAFCKAKAQGAKIKAPKIDRQGAFQIASELRRIGVNVNQIAKHLNSGLNVPKGQINALQEELSKLWQLFNSAIQK